MNLRIRIINYARDIRSRQQQQLDAAIAQEQADQTLEKLWRERVAQNIRQRKANQQRIP